MMRQLTGETKTTHGLWGHTQETPSNGNERALPRHPIGAVVRKARTRLGAWLVAIAASLSFAGPAERAGGSGKYGRPR